jgi:septin family protein
VIHLCLYIYNNDNDAKYIKRISEVTNIIPIIDKCVDKISDYCYTLNDEDLLKKYKEQIKSPIHMYGRDEINRLCSAMTSIDN